MSAIGCFPDDPGQELSPVGCFSLSWPAIENCLVSAEQRRLIEKDAAALPAIPRVALEFRLGSGNGNVDLHQLITGSDGDAAILKRHVALNPDAVAADVSLRNFLVAWAEDEYRMRSDMEGIFLEWDRTGSSMEESVPAIFVPVQRRSEARGEGPARRVLIADHIQRFGLGPDSGRRVRELFRFIPAELSISHVGLMGTRGDAVRLNLRRIRPDELRPILKSLGWQGNHDVAEQLFRELVQRTGRVAVALDFAPDLKPSIGFEAALDGLPSSEPRWHDLLDYLVAEGLCTAAKSSALLNACARLYPEEADEAWPASWVAAAVMAPQRFVPWLERRLSHAKVSIAADGIVSAKAYLSAQHFWSRGESSLQRARPTARWKAPSAALEAAARRAVEFLLRARDQDDLWRDFRISNGMSDEWVTAFIGCALARSHNHVPREVIEQTIGALLRRQRLNGGWGYNAVSPADSDTTAWVLKFLTEAGYSGTNAAAGRAFLLSNVLPCGGLSAYGPGTELRFAGDHGPVDDRGWRGNHLCVAANAAPLLQDTLIDNLLSHQSAEGCWTAYWWRNDIFATALAVDALAAGASGHLHRQRAQVWALHQADSATTAFDMSGLVQLLSLGAGDAPHRARELALNLVALQREDGGWDGSAEMLFPNPSELRRDAAATAFVDERGLFTTAAALMAIEQVCQGLRRD